MKHIFYYQSLFQICLKKGIGSENLKHVWFSYLVLFFVAFISKNEHYLTVNYKMVIDLFRFDPLFIFEMSMHNQLDCIVNFECFVL